MNGAAGLQVLDTLPQGLLGVSAAELHRVLSGPTLLHLPGKREQPLFVSTLLHGNEDVGLKAVQQLLQDYQGKPLPRALSIFIGNVAAAREGLRRLPDQPDFNRVWPGCEEPDSPERRMLAGVVDEMRARNVFASIDLHNNTGMNPHYCCVNRLDHRYLQLATLFGRTVVYFVRPLGVQSTAFASLCPAVTAECGRVGDARGVTHARDYLDACLHLSDIPTHPVAVHDIDLFHTVATVFVPDDIVFGFGAGDAALNLVEDIDMLNFRELTPGTVFGCLGGSTRDPLTVCDERGDSVFSEYFYIENRELRLRRAIMPSMLTRDERVIRQDCLCYFMERLPLP